MFLLLRRRVSCPPARLPMVVVVAVVICERRTLFDLPPKSVVFCSPAHEFIYFTTARLLLPLAFSTYLIMQHCLISILCSRSLVAVHVQQFFCTSRGLFLIRAPMFDDVAAAKRAADAGLREREKIGSQAVN